MMVAAIYPYLVAAHVTAVVFLVGGLLAQERIVNAISQSPPEAQTGVLVALQRFERTVTTPALLLTWILGLSLALSAGWLSSGWLIVKLIFVVALSAFHGLRSGRIRRCLRTGASAEKIPGADLGIVVAMLVIAVLALVSRSSKAMETRLSRNATVAWEERTTVDTYRLHYFPESGNSYKLALMLTLCGQTFESIWTDFGARVTWTPEWRRTINPMGEIPVLEVNGRKLTQTAPILLQLAAQYEKFGATNDAETYELLRWLFWDNQKMSGGMATYRFLRTFTPKSDPAVLAWHLARVKDYLGILEQHLGATTFVACERLTIADISMCAYLSYPMDETGIDLTASYPNITAWLDRLMKMPGWKLPYELLPGKRLQRWSA